MVTELSARLARPSAELIARWEWYAQTGESDDSLAKRVWPFSNDEIRSERDALGRPRNLHGANRASSRGTGRIYALTNSSMPGLLKIGYTSGAPAQRAASLRTTGVPTPFVVGWSSGTLASVEAAEYEIHERLKRYRVDGGREFFRLALEDALPFLKQVEERYLEQRRNADLHTIEKAIGSVLKRQEPLVQEWKTWSKQPRVKALFEELNRVPDEHDAHGIVVGVVSHLLRGSAATQRSADRTYADLRRRRGNVWTAVRDMTSDSLWRQLAQFDWHFRYIWEGVGRMALAHEGGAPAGILVLDNAICWARSSMSPAICGAPATTTFLSQALCPKHAP